uniref:Protein distal antenna n=1 Tax=Diabrotica virgifera virgifera TaxID=50390 RepID=A0A6P7FY27_DIAVI
MSTKANKRPLRALTAHEKLDAIRRVHDGESKASVARDIGVPESTLRGWCKNEDKISYLSRQSSPETDESLDLKTQSKKPKLEESFTQPFNLSLKSHNSYSALQSVNLDSSTDVKTPLNLNTNSTESTPKSTNHLSERERNRAELARLSVELGLNRPEMFLPNINNSSILNDFSTNISLIAQWNALLTQQQQLKVLQANKSPKIVTTSADTSNAVSSSNNLLTTVDQDKNMSLPKDVQSVHDSVWYWLKSQQMLNMNSVSNANNLSTSSPANGHGMSPPITTTAVPSSSTPVSNGLNSVSPDQSSWFWKWYKQFAYKEQESNKPILYQQLTKELPQKEFLPAPVPLIDHQQNAENLSMKDEKQRPIIDKAPGYKVRSVLDNLLFNNNINLTDSRRQEKEDDYSPTQNEALEHGEMFLKWLESCSDPSVTAVQIMQFKTLLNNVKSGVDRKNCDLQNKAKVKRK